MREDPVRKGLLYAGTEHGFYVSLDDGDHWQPLSSGLPDTQVSDIWVEGNDLAIATHGRRFYVLDDVSPLRQYNASVTSTADAYLFKPGDAIRGGSPARITYWLKKPAQNLKLEILDSRGQVCARSTARCRSRQRPRTRRGRLRAGRAAATPAAGAAAATASGQALKGAAATKRQPAAARRRRRRRTRPRRSAAGDDGRRAALHLGSAVDAGRVVPGHGAVGRDAERTGRAAGHVSGAAHRRRPRRRRSRSR